MPDPLDQVTPVILTYNEQDNIGRTLNRLHWARRVVVIDSGSTDRTLEILAAYTTVEVFHRVFDTHATQWNHGLAQVQTPWALCLDADYQVTQDLLKELAQELPRAERSGVVAFVIPFRYLVQGKPLHGTVYPPKVVMFQPLCGRYRDDGHTQLPVVHGRQHTLRSPIDHDDRKPLSRWLWAQERYLRLEVTKLLATPERQLSRIDRLRLRHVIAPFAVLVVILVAKRGLLDGWRGWFYAFQRMYVETLLSLMLWEVRRGGGGAMEAPEQP